MEGSIRELCRLGIVHFMLYKDTITGGGSHASLLELIASPEFDAVECSWINRDDVRRSVAEARRKSGKTLAFGAQPVLLTQQLDLNSADEEQRRTAVAAVKAVIPQAYELGAEGFALLSGRAVSPADRQNHQNYHNAMDNLVRSLIEIADALAERGSIPLVLETFDQLPYGKNCLIGPNRDAARIAREVRKSHPGFGLMIDLSHLPLQGETPREAWEAVGEYLVHAHMGNCIMNKPAHPMNGDAHPPLCHPEGENGIDELADYLSVLYRGGFLNREDRPVLSFEVACEGTASPEAAEALLRQSLDTLKQAWRRV